jgi:hypothetical protein
MRRTVLRLPGQGRLLVGTDMQGNLNDFNRLLKHFDASGPDAHLLMTGDLVHGPSDALQESWPDFLGTAYRDQSPEIIEAFIAAQQRAPGRVHCLVGNHEHSHFGGPITSRFHEDEAAALERRLGPAKTRSFLDLLSTFPLVAITPCGLVMTHAAPAVALTSEQDLESLDWTPPGPTERRRHFKGPILAALLWARQASDEQVAQFLKTLGGTVSVFGHEVVREGFSRAGPKHLCLSTSFGLDDEFKAYVEVDLAGHYVNCDALRVGVEIKYLYRD